MIIPPIITAVELVIKPRVQTMVALNSKAIYENVYSPRPSRLSLSVCFASLRDSLKSFT